MERYLTPSLRVELCWVGAELSPFPWTQSKGQTTASKHSVRQVLREIRELL